MNIPEENISKFGEEFNIPTEKERKQQEEKEIAKLEEDTKIMNKETVLNKISELKTAYRNGDKKKLEALTVDFKKIYACLGNTNRDVILEDINSIKMSMSQYGASALSIARLKNEEAKLGIVDYKAIIYEASERPSEEDLEGQEYVYTELEKEENSNKRTGCAIIGGTAILVGALLIAGLGKGCNKKLNETTDLTTTTGITSELDPTTSGFEPTETLETVGNTTTSLETVNDDYSSPTRETTDANSNNNNGNNGRSNTTYATVGTTHNPTETSVIYKPTNPTTKPVSNETTTVQTDINGTQPGHTEPEIKPTGNDTLPVEPTRVTVDVNATPTPKPTATPTPKPTTTTTTTTETKADPTPTPKPTATPTPKPTPKPTEVVKPVPVETVDPDDENNVIEKTKKKVKATTKVLVLKPEETK